MAQKKSNETTGNAFVKALRRCLEVVGCVDAKDLGAFGIKLDHIRAAITHVKERGTALERDMVRKLLLKQKQQSLSSKEAVHLLKQAMAQMKNIGDDLCAFANACTLSKYRLSERAEDIGTIRSFTYDKEHFRLGEVFDTATKLNQYELMQLAKDNAAPTLSLLPNDKGGEVTFGLPTGKSIAVQLTVQQYRIFEYLYMHQGEFVSVAHLATSAHLQKQEQKVAWAKGPVGQIRKRLRANGVVGVSIKQKKDALQLTLGCS